MEMEKLEAKDWQHIVDECNAQIRQAKLMFSVNRVILQHATKELEKAEVRAKGEIEDETKEEAERKLYEAEAAGEDIL